LGQRDTASVKIDSFFSDLQHYGFIHSTCRASFSFIFVCEKFFFVDGSFVCTSPMRVFSYNFEIIGIDIDSVQISKDWNHILKIGLVGCISCVEITISDTWGNRIVLPYVNAIHWKMDIERLVQLTSLMIQEFQIEFVKIHDVDNVKLSLCESVYRWNHRPCSSCLDLQQCVEHVYYELYHE